VYGDSDGVADDIDTRTPLKWSQNNVWSQSRSPRGPYDSPHSTTDDERDFDDHSDRLLPEQMGNDRFEHSSHIDRCVTVSQVLCDCDRCASMRLPLCSRAPGNLKLLVRGYFSSRKT